MAYTEGETKKGVISKLYKVLQQESNNNNLDVKEKGEVEANIIITDEQWEETFKAGHRVTNSPTWREFDWKIKMRYVITPCITSRYSDSSEMCWRGCGLVGMGMVTIKDQWYTFQMGFPQQREVWLHVSGL